jgi:tRNA threonylcarbamoyl adenosine modification protein YeaZ
MLLAIETAYAACSVALVGPQGIVAARHAMIGRGHAERLVPMIGEVVARAEPPTAIAVDVGPGSFTGIRVGIAAARGLGLVWHAAVHGFAATALVAARVFADHPGLARLTVAMDAGRGELFVEHFAPGPASLAPVAALTPAAAAAGSGRDVAGTGAEALAAQRRDVRVLAAAPPDAADIVLLPAALRSLAPKPVYVRAPDAKLPAA